MLCAHLAEDSMHAPHLMLKLVFYSYSTLHDHTNLHLGPV